MKSLSTVGLLIICLVFVGCQSGYCGDGVCQVTESNFCDQDCSDEPIVKCTDRCGDGVCDRTLISVSDSGVNVCLENDVTCSKDCLKVDGVTDSYILDEDFLELDLKNEMAGTSCEIWDVNSCNSFVGYYEHIDGAADEVVVQVNVYGKDIDNSEFMAFASEAIDAEFDFLKKSYIGSGNYYSYGNMPGNGMMSLGSIWYDDNILVNVYVKEFDSSKADGDFIDEIIQGYAAKHPSDLVFSE